MKTSYNLNIVSFFGILVAGVGGFTFTFVHKFYTGARTHLFHIHIFTMHVICVLAVCVRLIRFYSLTLYTTQYRIFM